MSLYCYYVFLLFEGSCCGHKQTRYLNLAAQHLRHQKKHDIGFLKSRSFVNIFSAVSPRHILRVLCSTVKANHITTNGNAKAMSMVPLEQLAAEACSEAPLGISSLAAVPFSRSSRVPTKPLRRVYVYGQSCLRKLFGIVSGNLPVDQNQ